MKLVESMRQMSGTPLLSQPALPEWGLSLAMMSFTHDRRWAQWIGCWGRGEEGLAVQGRCSPAGSSRCNPGLHRVSFHSRSEGQRNREEGGGSLTRLVHRISFEGLSLTLSAGDFCFRLHCAIFPPTLQLGGSGWEGASFYFVLLDPLGADALFEKQV